jgi:phosphopantetheine--protein transferase-like protein
VGNDVVDLKARATAGRSKDDRFVSKVLTDPEKNVLNRCENPDSCLWAMWASKEASYKAISRTLPSICSSPRRYEVIFEKKCHQLKWAGKVSTPCGDVNVKVSLGENHIHSIAKIGLWPPESNLISRVFEIAPGSPQDAEPSHEQHSQSVRRAAAAAIAGLLKTDQKNIIIKRCGSSARPGPPVAHLIEIDKKIPISLSHHGRFGAFAFIAHDSLFF